MKKKLIIYMTLASVFFLMASIVVVSVSALNEDVVYDNVYIEKISVGKMTRTEMQEYLKRVYEFKSLVLVDGNKKFTKDLKEAGFDYKINQAVEEAFQIGRGGNVLQNLQEVFFLKMGGKETIPLEYTHNYKNLEKYFEEISKEVEREPVDAEIEAIGGKVQIKAGKVGKKVDMQKLVQLVKENIENRTYEKEYIQIPLIVKNPDLRYQYLKQINGMISSFQSKYSMSDYRRAYNVELAARKLDKRLIMPQEEISFMKELGNVTPIMGFKPAMVIMNNRFVYGTGGGVCQVSSTMYNALLEGGLDILERTHHSLPVRYVPLGRDATVSDPVPDLKYRNNYDFPIYVRNYAKNGVMRTEIYGNIYKKNDVEVFSQTFMGGGRRTAVTYRKINGETSVVSRDVYR